jgi:hypothetical protein
MRDVNKQLRQAYYGALNGHIDVPIYYAQLPDGTSPDAYVLINTIMSTSFDDDDYNHTKTAVQLLIISRALNNNDGNINDTVGNEVLRIVLPNPRASVIQISNGNVMNTTLTNDITTPTLSDGTKKVVQRVLTFSHIIQHKN